MNCRFGHTSVKNLPGVLKKASGTKKSINVQAPKNPANTTFIVSRLWETPNVLSLRCVMSPFLSTIQSTAIEKTPILHVVYEAKCFQTAHRLENMTAEVLW